MTRQVAIGSPSNSLLVNFGGLIYWLVEDSTALAFPRQEWVLSDFVVAKVIELLNSIIKEAILELRVDYAN